MELCILREARKMKKHWNVNQCVYLKAGKTGKTEASTAWLFNGTFTILKLRLKNIW
jgi:hypothetical protein